MNNEDDFWTCGCLYLCNDCKICEDNDMDKWEYFTGKSLDYDE